jgi:type IV pilus assembly protein PilV
MSRMLAQVSSRPREQGFTLVEVLAALVIISLGLLGIAKIQALAYASTGTASMRSLVAIEASGMASAMRANQAYWAVAPPNLAVSVTGTTVTASDAVLASALTAGTSCASATKSGCTTGALVAAYDLQQWANALNGVVAVGAGSGISCPQPPAGSPLSCSITVIWTEHTVSINALAGSAIGGAASSYTLVVEP